MVQQSMFTFLSRRCGRSPPTRGPPLPPMYSLARAFSSKLFVGGLSYRTDEEMLRKAFAEHGEVLDVKIITDHETGRSRGFGFVTFSQESDAEAAKSKLSNHLLDGRFIRVDMASARPPPAAARPFGNSSSSPSPSSSSPSGFSFGRVGSRPPVVEDWGLLPSYSAQVSQNTNTAQGSNTDYHNGMDTFNDGGQSINSNNTSQQGGIETFSGSHQTNVSSDPKPFDSNTLGYTSLNSSTFGTALPSAAFHGVDSSRSTTFGPTSSSSSNTSSFQSSTNTLDFQSSTFGATSFDSNTSGTIESTTATQSTVTNSGMGLPDLSSSMAPQAGELGSGLGLQKVSGVDSSSPAGIGVGPEQGLSSIDSTQAGVPASGQASSFRGSLELGGSGLGVAQGSNFSGAAEAEGPGLQSGLDSVDNIEIAGAKLRLDSSGVSSHSITSPSESSEGYDFRNFPALNSSSYKDYKLRSELQEPKRRVVLQSSSKVSTFQSKLTVESIPPPKGPAYDFGLGDIPSSPPPLEVAARPHGGFDINVNLDDLKEAEPVQLPYSIFSQRALPPLDLPWDTPEADNWSEIGKPPRRIEDSPYSPFSSDLKDDPEFWWDPYDFDAEAKLPREPEAEAPAAVNSAA